MRSRLERACADLATEFIYLASNPDNPEKNDMEKSLVETAHAMIEEIARRMPRHYDDPPG